MSKPTTTTTYHSDDDAIADMVNAPNSFWRMNEHIIVSGARYFTPEERDEFIENSATLSIIAVVFEPHHVYNGKAQPRWVITAAVNEDMGRISFTDNDHRGTIFRLMMEYLEGHPGAIIPAVMRELPPQIRGHQPYRFLTYPDSFVPAVNDGNSDN